MVESKDGPGDTSSCEKVNFDQLVHIKAFQDGYLEYLQKYKSVPGRFWGQRLKPHRFDETSSFLPFELLDKGNVYRRGEEFVDLPRPYQPGYEAPPTDDGSFYEAKNDQLKQDIHQ